MMTSRNCFSIALSRQLEEAVLFHKMIVMEKFVKIVFVFIFGLFLMPLHAAAADNDYDYSDSDSEWKPVIEALIQVESNGNSNAKHGASVGVLQITPVLVAECNNILRRRRINKRYTLSDRKNRSKSIEMFLLFQSWFNPKKDLELAIRSWNGGLHYSVSKTQKYFEKVLRILRNN